MSLVLVRSKATEQTPRSVYFTTKASVLVVDIRPQPMSMALPKPPTTTKLPLASSATPLTASPLSDPATCAHRVTPGPNGRASGESSGANQMGRRPSMAPDATCEGAVVSEV